VRSSAWSSPSSRGGRFSLIVSSRSVVMVALPHTRNTCGQLLSHCAQDRVTSPDSLSLLRSPY
jgi:hypothetical protein